MEEDDIVDSLFENSMTQIKIQKEKKMKKAKVKLRLFTDVSQVILIRIMILKSHKET